MHVLPKWNTRQLLLKKKLKSIVGWIPYVLLGILVTIVGFAFLFEIVKTMIIISITSIIFFPLRLLGSTGSKKKE